MKVLLRSVFIFAISVMFVGCGKDEKLEGNIASVIIHSGSSSYGYSYTYENDNLIYREWESGNKFSKTLNGFNVDEELLKKLNEYQYSSTDDSIKNCEGSDGCSTQYISVQIDMEELKYVTTEDKENARVELETYFVDLFEKNKDKVIEG